MNGMIILGISVLSSILIGALAGMAAGFTLATLLLRKQLGNRITYEIGKLRAKKDGRIDVNQDNATEIPEPRKRKKLFKRKNKT